MHKRTCSIPSCDRPHRARGLCGSHYNQAHQPNRHAAKLTSCTVCARLVMRPFKSDRRPVCSVECLAALSGAEHGAGYDWAGTAASRARSAGAPVIEVFDRVEIFERDNWICYLCNEPVDRMAGPFDPSYPTVDHVKPLSQGGEHSRVNAKTACFACNSARLNFTLT